VRHPGKDELAGWARSAGLDVVELWSWGFPTYAFTKWATNLNPQMALSRFGGERRYGAAEIAVSTALYFANFVNLRSSPLGVQLFGLFRKGPA
jgi:hypothetical protein